MPCFMHVGPHTDPSKFTYTATLSFAISLSARLRCALTIFLQRSPVLLTIFCAALMHVSSISNALKRAGGQRHIAAAATVLPPVAAHPVVYHEDFRINPIPEGHRFPM